MAIDLNILAGGEAGQGIQTVGDLLSRVCVKSGLYLTAVNDFESRIRGGHSFFQMRISGSPVGSPSFPLHLIVALSPETIELHRDELAEEGLIIADSGEQGDEGSLKNIPITRLAEEAGGRIMANTAAAGAVLSLCGAPFEPLKEVLSERFANAGAKVLENNLKAAESGFRAVQDISFSLAFEWPMSGEKGMLIDGAKALAMGALAADCRFAAFYPMTPSTGIMVNLAEFSDSCPLVVEQAEDEIAAVNMVIGASFAGARALTATSGGGFCLMTEGLGLAGITETPLVIINAQRPGPATGLPTRTAQGDLLFVIRAAQDEFPRFVFAPKSVEEAFEVMIRAFELSEKYQVPAVVLADQFFTDSLALCEKPFSPPGEVRRYLVHDQDMDDPGSYKRYALSASGVSPRALPCAGKALVCASGNEHREDGHISEEISDRVNMVDKRSAKIKGMLSEMNPPGEYHSDSRFIIACWGSSYSAVKEAVDILRQEGYDAGLVHFTDLWPFPSEASVKVLERKTVFTAEQNSTGQLGSLICEQTGIRPSGAVLKYDGRPMCARDVVRQFKKIAGENNG